MFKNKKVVVLTSIIIVFSLMFLYRDIGLIKTKAEGTQINDYVLSCNINILPFNENYLLISSNEENIKVCTFNPDENVISEFFSLSDLDSDLFSAKISKNKAYIARNSSNKLAVTYFDASYNCRTVDIANKSIEKEDDFAVFSSEETENIFIKKYKDPNMVYYSSLNDINNFTEIKVNCTLINSIKANKSGDSLYLFADGKAFLFDNNSFREIPCEQNIQAPVCFVDDNTIIDANSSVFKLNSSSNSLEFKKAFCFKKSTNKNFSFLYEGKISTAITPRVLYFSDYESGNPSKQKTFNEDILCVCANPNNFLVVTKEDDKIFLNCLTNKDLENVEEKSFSLENSPKKEIDVKNDFINSYPTQSSAKNMYISAPDIETFSSIGQVSESALNDGLNAINFYRSLYGLTPIKLDSSLCEQAQYSSILALVKDDLSDPKKPENMSDNFFNKACSVFDIDCICKDCKFSKNVIPDSIHAMFNSNVNFRNLILSSKTSSVGFGLSNNQNASSVFVNLNTDRDFNYTNDVFSAFPKDGYYPSNWLPNTSNIFSVNLNNENLLCGFNGTPCVKITNNSTQEVFESTANISNNNSCLTFSCPDLDPENPSEYNIKISNLCTLDGLCANIQYNLCFSKLPMYDNDDPEDPESDVISSDVYNIDTINKIITGITPGTTASSFKNNLYLKEGYHIRLLNYKDNNLQSGKVGTNTKVIVSNSSGKDIDKYYVLIYGEVSGEGNINSRDSSIIYNFLLNKNPLSEIFLLAADINHDSYVNALDSLLLEKYINSEYAIDQKGKSVY